MQTELSEGQQRYARPDVKHWLSETLEGYDSRSYGDQCCLGSHERIFRGQYDFTQWVSYVSITR